MSFNGFNDHKEYEGKHAFLSPSQYRFLNWDDETLLTRFRTQYSQSVGTVLHALASFCIERRIKIRKTDTSLIRMEMEKNFIPSIAYDADALIDNFQLYVNDAISFRMVPEKVLFYSKYAFGTTDSIRYTIENKELRIHDYKSGESPAGIEQPMVYAALFCLEYLFTNWNNWKKDRPNKIILRIYQEGNQQEQIFINNDSQENADLINDEKSPYADMMCIEKIMEIIIRQNNILMIRKGLY